MASSFCQESPQLEWYKIRDLFFGENDIPLVLQLAASCSHPDARWLADVCSKKDVKTKEEAKQVFLARGENDARALCFAWLLSGWFEQLDTSRLRRSAEMGYAFAQSELACRVHGQRCLEFAQLAAFQGERDGFYWLGCCFRDGQAGEVDMERAKENLLIASNQGHARAMVELGKLVDGCERWSLWGRAAACGNPMNFLSDFPIQVKSFISGSGSAAVMFVIGQALHGHVHMDARAIFKETWQFDSLIEPAKQAIAFYEGQIKATRDAIHSWIQVGLRMKLVKDVRKVIAKMIWEARGEALYEGVCYNFGRK